MADGSDTVISDDQSEELPEKRELAELKRDLEGWREALLPLSCFLTWEKPHYPAIIFGVTTFVFALIWFFEPSVLTTFAVLGLVVTGIDFAVPLVGPYLFSDTPWTGREERQFEELCEKILHFRTHVIDFVQGIITLKQERPKMYFAVVMAVLAFFAWIGHTMNNLFLTYFFVLTALMIPGLRHTGLLQQYVLQYWLMVKRLVLGRRADKSKTN